MRIFLCWSGMISEKIATALYEFLGDVIQELKPFLSTESIRKGDRWRSELSQQLAETDFGILCLTKENLQAPWILFEAGALSKNLVNGRVTALLTGIQPTEVIEPLSQFQHTRSDREDILRLLKDINNLLPEEKRLTIDRLERVFSNYWPGLEKKLSESLQEGAKVKGSAPKRTTDDMVGEILELVRELKRSGEPVNPSLAPWSAGYLPVSALTAAGEGGLLGTMAAAAGQPVSSVERAEVTEQIRRRPIGNPPAGAMAAETAESLRKLLEVTRPKRKG